MYGKPQEYSDIDVILVSERFWGMPHHERRWLFRRVTKLDQDPNAEVVDVPCYTPAEFEEKAGAPTIVREAVEKGIWVA